MLLQLLGLAHSSLVHRPPFNTARGGSGNETRLIPEYLRVTSEWSLWEVRKNSTLIQPLNVMVQDLVSKTAICSAIIYCQQSK